MFNTDSNSPSHAAASRLAEGVADLMHLGTNEEKYTFRRALHASLAARAIEVLDELICDADMVEQMTQAWVNRRLNFLGQRIEISPAPEIDDDGLDRLLDDLGLGDEDDDPTAID